VSAAPISRLAHLFTREAETPLAALVFANRIDQIAFAEIRPHQAGVVDLRVGDLPEQKIGNPQLCPGSNQQVWIGHFRIVEVCGKRLLIDTLGIDLSELRISHQFACRIDDLRTPSVGKRKDQRHV